MVKHHRYAVTTSFNEHGLEQYGRRFVDSFLRYWPESVHLFLWQEGFDEPWSSPRVHGLHLHSAEMQMLVQACKDRRDETDSSHSTLGVTKWCKKVFALTTWSPECTWWVWIDGDVETIAPVRKPWLERVFPDDKSLVFLGRDHCEIGRAETGFVGYRVTDFDVRQVLKEMRRIYTSHDVFEQRDASGKLQRGDAFTFDVARKKILGEDHWKYHNLAADIDSYHPWPKTVLGEVMVHHKGARRKRKAYGRDAPGTATI